MEYQPLASFEHWPDLPTDIQQDILLKLPIQDLLNFTSSSKLMLEKIKINNLLWRTLYYQRAGANELKESVNTSDWKTRFQEMFEMAHLWTCHLCHGFPIDGYAYKCMYCEDFKCCHTCYEKHGHFKNHVVLKYYNRLGDNKIRYRVDNSSDYNLMRPKCGKCQVNLDYPTNRSATDPQLYLCDTCLKDSEFTHHTIYRIVKREVELDNEPDETSIHCIECGNGYTLDPANLGAEDWPHVCLTCRKSYTSGDLCAKCYSSHDVKAKHQGHNIIKRPIQNYHSCLCDICRWSMRYGVRYRCSVCFDYDFCEPCEPRAVDHFDGRHPMMIIHQQRQRNHVECYSGQEEKSDIEPPEHESGYESMGEVMYTD